MIPWIFFIISTICLGANIFVLTRIQKVYVNRNHFYVDFPNIPSGVSKGLDTFGRFIIYVYMSVWTTLVAFCSAIIVFSYVRVTYDNCFLLDGIITTILCIPLIYYWIQRDFLKPLKEFNKNAQSKMRQWISPLYMGRFFISIVKFIYFFVCFEFFFTLHYNTIPPKK